MTSTRSARTPGEVAAILEQLQLLADTPWIRHRLGYGRALVNDLPFADSRRPIDPADRTRPHIMDNAAHTRDAESNYWRGLL